MYSISKFLDGKYKKKNKTTKVLGYLHCAPWPLQTDLIFRDFFIDTLFVSSKNQKIVLEKYLKWNKNKIKVIPSLRFTKTKKKSLIILFFFLIISNHTIITMKDLKIYI